MKSTSDFSFRYIGLLLLVILVAAVLWYVREVIRPLITAALIAYLLSPLVNLLTERLRLSRKLAANVVFFVAVILLVSIPAVVIPTVFDDANTVIADLSRLFNNLESTLNQPAQIFGVHVYLGAIIPNIRSNVTGRLNPQPGQALQLLQTTSRGFLWFLVIMVSTYYLMVDWVDLRGWLIRLAPEDQRGDITRLYMEIREVWLRYLQGQVRLMLILMIIYAIAWSVIGVPGAILLGILAGLLNLLPEVGPFLIAILATLVALLEGSTFLPISHVWFAALTLGLYLLLNNFKTIWLQPRILGRSVLLHEGVVFVAIIVALVLQGFLGVLIVVPLLASLGVIGRYARRRMLGLPPFDDPEAPVEPETDSPQPDSNANQNSSASKQKTLRKTNKSMGK